MRCSIYFLIPWGPEVTMVNSFLFILSEMFRDVLCIWKHVCAYAALLHLLNCKLDHGQHTVLLLFFLPLTVFLGLCIVVHMEVTPSFFFLRFYLFIFRQGEERERGRETSKHGCLSRALYWGLGLQLKHVPWLGTEPATLWLAGLRSIHWATPARALNVYVFLSTYR